MLKWVTTGASEPTPIQTRCADCVNTTIPWNTVAAIPRATTGNGGETTTRGREHLPSSFSNVSNFSDDAARRVEGRQRIPFGESVPTERPQSLASLLHWKPPRP